LIAGERENKYISDCLGRGTEVGKTFGRRGRAAETLELPNVSMKREKEKVT